MLYISSTVYTAAISSSYINFINGFNQKSKCCNLSDICGEILSEVELVCTIVQNFYFPKLKLPFKNNSSLSSSLFFFTMTLYLIFLFIADIFIFMV